MKVDMGAGKKKSNKPARLHHGLKLERGPIHKKETRGQHVGGKELKDIKFDKKAAKIEASMIQNAQDQKASVRRSRPYYSRLVKHA